MSNAREEKLLNIQAETASALNWCGGCIRCCSCCGIIGGLMTLTFQSMVIYAMGVGMQ